MGVGAARPAPAGQGIGGPANAAPLPGSSPLPWDARATAETAGAIRKGSDSLATLQANDEIQKRNFGIESGYDNSPYSQAALLQRRHDIEHRGALAGAGRQLYAGSTVNHLRGTDFAFSRDMTSLREQAEAAAQQNARERTAAEHDEQNAAEEAQAGAIERAEEAEPDASAAPAGKKKIRRKNQGKKGGKAR